MRLITPANVAAAAPFIEQGFGLFFSWILSTQVDEIVRNEIRASPDLTLEAVGKDTTAFEGLKRYLSYGSRVENTLEISILAVVSIILAEFERTGQVKHYRAWRVHRDAMNIALLKKLITEAARRAFK